MKKQPLYFYFMLAGVFNAMAPIASDLYLPSLPHIADYYHAAITTVQLSITTFIFGFALSRIVLATWSDFVGRRRPLLIALLICVFGGLLCWLSSNIHIFLFGRLVQGFGAGGSNVLSRVMIRDTVPVKELPKYNSYNSMIGVTMMAAAPLFGGYIQHYFNWHLVFLILFIYALLAFVLAWFVIPETNEHHHTTTFCSKALRNNFLTLVGSKTYLKYAFIVFLVYGSMVAWLTMGPVVLQKALLLSPVQYGWCAALVALGYFLGALLNSRIVGKVGVLVMMRIGALSILLSGAILFVSFVGFHVVTVCWVVWPTVLMFFGCSLLFANTYGVALIPYAKIAGIAVAVLGSIQLMGGVLTSAIISWAPDVNQLPSSIIYLIVGVFLMVLLRMIACLHSCSKRQENSL